MCATDAEVTITNHRIAALKMSNAAHAKKGHLALTAAQQRAPGQGRKSGQQLQRSRTTHHMSATKEDVSDTSNLYKLFTLQAGSQSKPLLVTVKANSSDLEMEIDTGAQGF